MKGEWRKMKIKYSEPTYSEPTYSEPMKLTDALKKLQKEGYISVEERICPHHVTIDEYLQEIQNHPHIDDLYGDERDWEVVIKKDWSGVTIMHVLYSGYQDCHLFVFTFAAELKEAYEDWREAREEDVFMKWREEREEQARQAGRAYDYNDLKEYEEYEKAEHADSAWNFKEESARKDFLHYVSITTRREIFLTYEQMIDLERRYVSRRHWIND
jgi:hypothetical protein